MSNVGDSLSPYAHWQEFIADDPAKLVEILNSIKVPHKVIGFNSYGTRQVAYVVFTRKPRIKKIIKEN